MSWHGTVFPDPLSRLVSIVHRSPAGIPCYILYQNRAVVDRFYLVILSSTDTVSLDQNSSLWLETRDA